MAVSILAPLVTTLAPAASATAVTTAINLAAYIGVSRAGMLLKKPEAR